MSLSPALLSLALITALPGSAESTPTTAMDSYVREHMDAVGTPGLAYAVVDAEGVVNASAFGVDGEGAPVTPRTPFLWGSVAKPVAATAALTLVEEGLLDLDTRVDAPLPAFSDFAAAPSVRDLLTQTSGITARAGFAVGDDYGPDSADTDARVARVAASTPGTPGEHEYSSANYLVLGAVIEAVTGADPSSYMRDAVLEPVGMTRTFTTAEEARELGLAAGRRTLWGVPAPVPPQVDDGGATYGYLGGDLRALAAFDRLQLTEDPPILDTATLAEARTGSVRLSPERAYGLGWRDAPVPGVTEHVVWHGGSTPGHAAMILVLPESERAVVVLQNAYDHLRDARVQSVGFGLAHLVTGGDAPERPGTDPWGPALVWGSTALVPLSVAGLVTAVRDRARGSIGRRWRPWAWSLFGALTLVMASALSMLAGVRTGLLWFPEGTVAILMSAALGGAALVWRSVTALRSGRGSRRPPRGSDP
ncbi:serine hydrolase [Nocardiopsis sp. MG754419]|uniref:serine hydrolase domain-containing protein n=1 Tax=Nocardiopsis sp. MG754419 TaxID=2259865 RepID=UPI001BAC1671|nr:serine hydrolase domain-containing protein [Nocardiopsis sp. MG754419]MBR8742917.1 serine hydrolase [Nocardiopsis sp. MG754419]